MVSLLLFKRLSLLIDMPGSIFFSFVQTCYQYFFYFFLSYNLNIDYRKNRWSGSLLPFLPKNISGSSMSLHKSHDQCEYTKLKNR